MYQSSGHVYRIENHVYCILFSFFVSNRQKLNSVCGRQTADGSNVLLSNDLFVIRAHAVDGNCERSAIMPRAPANQIEFNDFLETSVRRFVELLNSLESRQIQ